MKEKIMFFSINYLNYYFIRNTKSGLMCTIPIIFVFFQFYYAEKSEFFIFLQIFVHVVISFPLFA